MASLRKKRSEHARLFTASNRTISSSMSGVSMPFCCRFCQAPLSLTVCDLGTSPASNSFVRPEHAQLPEPFYPLRVYVCSQCFLVQLPEHKPANEIFNDDYVYFSS